MPRRRNCRYGQHRVRNHPQRSYRRHIFGLGVMQMGRAQYTSYIQIQTTHFRRVITVRVLSQGDLRMMPMVALFSHLPPSGRLRMKEQCLNRAQGRGRVMEGCELIAALREVSKTWNMRFIRYSMTISWNVFLMNQ